MSCREEESQKESNFITKWEEDETTSISSKAELPLTIFFSIKKRKKNDVATGK